MTEDILDEPDGMYSVVPEKGYDGMFLKRKISMMCMGADPAWRRVIPDDAKQGSEKQASFFRSEEG